MTLLYYTVVTTVLVIKFHGHFWWLLVTIYKIPNHVFKGSAKTISNRSNMKAWVKSNTAYSSVTNQSLVGYGDAEMLRDQHTIFPISYGGRVDWYIRGQAALQVTSQVAEATLVSVSGSTSLWRVSLDKDVFPGLYEIRKVRREVDSADEA